MADPNTTIHYRATGTAAHAGFGGLDAFPDNAIAFALIRLGGGWRNLVVTGGLYGLILAGAIVAAVRAIDLPPAQICNGLLRVMLGVQAGLLLLVGATRVSAAVRNDLTGGMIESHRLMPLGPGRAVAGYLFGSTAQMLVLAGLTLAAGIPTAAGAGVPVADWLAANAVVGLFAAFVWTLLLPLAFAFRSPMGWAVLPILTLWISQGYLLTAVPAVGLLVGPLMGRTAFSLAPAAGPMLTAYAASAAAQIAVGGVCFAVARRQYARGDAVGLSPGLGLALLAAFVLASWAGTALAVEAAPFFVRRPPGVLVQIVCSLLLLMVLAQLPVASAARMGADWRRRRDRDPAGAGPRPLPLPAVAALAGLLVTAAPGLMFLAASTASRANAYKTFRLDDGPPTLTEGLAKPITLTAAVAVLGLLATGFAVQVVARTGRPAKAAKSRRAGGGIVLGWFFLAWVGPVLVDVVRAAQSTNGGPREALGVLSGCSPIGAIIQIWREALDLDATDGLSVVGLAAQAVVAAVMASLAYAPSGTRPAATRGPAL